MSARSPARLFVAVWLPENVLDTLAALPRPPTAGVRWTTPDQWHVTLMFLGALPEEQIPALGAALATAAAGSRGPFGASLGPATTLLGRSVLCVPAAGLDELAAGTRAAFQAVGAGGHDAERPFRGHCTLALGRGGRPVPADLAGCPVEARWSVSSLSLVRSNLDPGGARYEALRTETVPQ